MREAEVRDQGQLLSSCERCPVPALLIHGSEDPRPSQGVRLLADHLPNARFIQIEDAGHLPWVERPSAVRAAIGEFLRQVV